MNVLEILLGYSVDMYVEISGPPLFSVSELEDSEFRNLYTCVRDVTDHLFLFVSFIEIEASGWYHNVIGTAKV